jgi:hypothetical protein
VTGMSGAVATSRYSPVVVSGPIGKPGIVDAGGEWGESDDALWVRSFLLTQPGKTYRIESTDDAREAAAREAVQAAARVLTDEVVRGARAAGTADAAEPTQSS